MTTTHRFTDRQTKEIQTFVNICFHAIGEENTKALAQKTGLCVSTIYRLQRAMVSPDTHIGTIQALARAAGLQLVFAKNGRVFMEAA